MSFRSKKGSSRVVYACLITMRLIEYGKRTCQQNDHLRHKVPHAVHFFGVVVGAQDTYFKHFFIRAVYAEKILK